MRSASLNVNIKVCPLLGAQSGGASVASVGAEVRWGHLVLVLVLVPVLVLVLPLS